MPNLSDFCTGRTMSITPKEWRSDHPNFCSIDEPSLNQTLLSYSEYFLVATYIDWRLSFLVLREAISLQFYNKDILQTNVKNALEQKMAKLHDQLLLNRLTQFKSNLIIIF